MQLQQSTFFFYEYLILKPPKIVFMVLLALLSALLLTNFIIVAHHHKQPLLTPLLESYYHHTHHNITTFVQTHLHEPITEENVNDYFQFVNMSTCLGIIVSEEPVQHPIKDTPSEVKDYPHPIIHLCSNKALMRINDTNKEAFIQKHNIQYHSLVIERKSVDPGFMYLGQSADWNVFEALMENLGLSLNILDQRLQITREEEAKHIDDSIIPTPIPTPELNQGETDEQQEDKPSQKDPNQPQIQAQNTEDVSDMQQPTTEQTQSQLQKQAVKTQQSQQAQQSSTEQKRSPAQLATQTLQLLKPITSDIHISYHPPGTKNYYTISFSEYFGEVYFSGLNKIKFLIFGFIAAYVLSLLIGLFVRFFYVSLMSVLGVVAGKCLSKWLGWVWQYVMVVRHASTPNKVKLLVFLLLSMGIIFSLFTFGIWLLSYALLFLYSPLIHCIDYLSSIFLNLFLIQLLHYLFLRSRTSLTFFSTFSLILTGCIVSYSLTYPIHLTSYLIHLHLVGHLWLMVWFLLAEKMIQEDEFAHDYKPSFQKPRMLYYVGFDLDWHKSVPPTWTYFMQWYDWTFLGEREKVYLERDYQLLYGRLMGMDQPQQLPEQNQQQHDLNEGELSEQY